VAFTLLALMLSVLVSGLAPARHVVKLDVSELLKAEQGATGATGGWQKKLLVVGQVPVSVALFSTANSSLPACAMHWQYGPAWTRRKNSS
jgi:hypothetical protein